MQKIHISTTFSEILMLNIRYISDATCVQIQVSLYMRSLYFVLRTSKYICRKWTFDMPFYSEKKKKNLWIIPPIVLMFFRTSLSLNHTATCGRKVHTEGGGGIYLCIRRKMIYFNVKSLQGHHCSLFSFSFILSQIFLRYKRLQKT